MRANHKEFFAGLTTRYFESKERRKEIVERDPILAKKLETYWGKPRSLMNEPLSTSAVTTLIRFDKRRKEILLAPELKDQWSGGHVRGLIGPNGFLYVLCNDNSTSNSKRNLYTAGSKVKRAS